MIVISLSFVRRILLYLCCALFVEIGHSSHLLHDHPSKPIHQDLVAFHAEQMGGEVLLEIEFYEESKIDSFWIERSDDGLSFKKVLGKTNLDSTSSSYRLFDKITTFKKVESYVYYKIKMFHFEGKVEYSSIGGLMLEKPQKWKVDFQADSTNKYLEIELLAPQKERIELWVINGSRKTYALERAELHKGINRLQIDISAWPNQFYFLTVKSSSYFERHNFMK